MRLHRRPTLVVTAALVVLAVLAAVSKGVLPDTTEAPTPPPFAEPTASRPLESLDAVATALATILANPKVEGCHGTTHTIGKQAAMIAAPLDALQINSPEVDQRCQYGYMHGLFQGYAARGIEAISTARTGCPSAPGGPHVITECFHAAGHGVAITRSSLEESLADCATLRSPHDLECATGVFMEYAESYRFGNNRAPDLVGYAPLLTHTEAQSVCERAGERWLPVCAKEAPTFWGQTNQDPSYLGRKCHNLTALQSPEVVRLCGVGVGRLVQNMPTWDFGDAGPVPQTSAQAQTVSRSIAESCIAAYHAVTTVQFWSGCIEAAMQPMLSGQVSTNVSDEVRIDPCRFVAPNDATDDLHRECVRLRASVISSSIDIP